MNLPPDMTHGAMFATKNYGDLYVVKYHNSQTVDVIFANTGHTRTTTAGNLRRRAMRDQAPIRPGDVYGRLTVVVARAAKGRRGHWSATCRCVCGVVKGVNHCSLRSGGATSCGCYAEELNSARRRSHSHAVGAT